MANEIAKKLSLKPEQFLSVLQALGVNYTEQSGFYKVHGPTGRLLYVGKGKICTRIDLSGFETEFGTKQPDQGVFGNVKQQMAWAEEATAEDILRLFGSLVEHMMSLAPVEKKEKVAKTKAPKNAGAEVKTEDVLPDSEEAKAARLARIRKAAKDMGVDVSAKTEAELAPAPIAEETPEASA